MRVLAKSLLDLVPLAIVTIIISVLASQSLDELSVSYNEIISEDLSVVNRLNDADRALDNWKSLINEGVLNSAVNAALASQDFEKLSTEKNNLQKSLTEVINILEGKRARFIAGGSDSNQQSENESDLTEGEEQLTFQIESLKFLKEKGIATIQDRSKKIQSMTQFSASTQRDLLFSMSSSVQKALLFQWRVPPNHLKLLTPFKLILTQ